MVNCSLKACVEENLDMGLDSGVILLLLDLAESALARDVYNVYDLYIVDACNIVWKGSFLETRPTRWRKVEGLTVPLIMTRFARQVDSSRRKRQRLLRLTTRALAQRNSAQRIQVCQQH